MVDIHCHILPGIDDGSQSMEESMNMIQMAVDQGFKCFIATSHASGHFPKSTPDTVRDLCRQVETEAIKTIDGQIRIYPGQEIMYTADLMERLDAGQYLTLADTSWILLEFQPSTPWSVIFGAVRNLAMSPYRPVIAHVERYRALVEDESRMEELMENGARLQMNYRSLEGGWFDKKASRCRKLVKAGYIQYLGTDMHNTENRSPDTEGAMRWMRKHLSEEEITGLCGKNADEILTENV